MIQYSKGQAPKAVCLTLWFRDHNNPRYADLFPRLSPLVRFFKITLSRHRVTRGVQFRLWNLLGRKLLYPVAARFLGRRYETLFTVDLRQIPAWPRMQSVVVDVDDPVFDPKEVETLNLPQIKAVVVTTERAKAIFQELGVTRPIHVIPQGINFDTSFPTDVPARRPRRDNHNAVVVGYHAPSLTMRADGKKRARGDQDDLDFLFAAVEQARTIESRLELWLFGEPSESVKEYVGKGRQSWIKMFGYIPLSKILQRIKDVDIGVYPRTWMPPPGRFSVKLAQFMACGVPVISTKLDESFILEDARCGIVCRSQQDFAAALLDLARSPEKRIELGKAGRRYAQSRLDWSLLIPTYREILTGADHDN